MVAGGDVIYASDVNEPAAVLGSSAEDASGLTGTAYFGGYTAIGAVFTAPASGRAAMSVLAMLGLATANGSVYAGVIVRTGDVYGGGTVVYDPKTIDPGCKVVIQSPTANLVAQLGVSTILAGLTPGARYNAQVMTWAGAAGVTYSYYGREVSVSPVP